MPDLTNFSKGIAIVPITASTATLHVECPLLKLFALILFCCVFTTLQAEECASHTMIIAHKLHVALDPTGLPTDAAWNSAGAPVIFCVDWQGRNPDPQRQTEVRVLWSTQAVYLQFRAHYRTLYTYSGGPERRDKLWDRDVAEVFLQNDAQSGKNYSEIETSPNGDWIDLAITAAGHTDLRSGMHSRVTVNESARIWMSEIALPMQSLTTDFDPKRPWRVNFFRIEGPEPERFYSCWRPTNTDRPNFHVPEAFGVLQFHD